MRYFLIIALGCIIAFSCRKEYSSKTKITDDDTAWKIVVADSAPLNQLLQKLQDSPQTDSFDLKKGDTLEFFNDTLEIIFPPSVCVGSGGMPVMGEAKVQVIFLRKKGDFIRYEKPASSNDYLLITGGAVYIHVTQNNIPLQIGAGHITIRYKDPAPDGAMQLFYGNTAASNTGNFDWILGSPQYGRVSVLDSSALNPVYEILSQKLEWINCDKFIDSTINSTTVITSLPASCTNANTAVFIVFKEQRTVIRMQADVEHQLFSAEHIPVGVNVEIISLSLLGDEFYMAAKTLNITNNVAIALSPEVKTQDEIRTYLNGL